MSAGTAGLQSCTDPTKKRGKFKVGLIANGPKNDWGYNSAHEKARLFLQQTLDQDITTQLIENVPETADATRVIERIVQLGTKLVFATSFGYQDTVYDLAGKYTDVQFLQAWGFKKRLNMGAFSAKMYEAWYVVGMVAGLMSKSGHFGVVAAHPIPPMKWQINAFLLGARSVKPETTASVIFINKWSDASLAAEATSALIEQGADVVTGVLDSSISVAQTAEARGVYVVGHNTDLSRFAPTKILTGTEWLWGGLYVQAAKDVLGGAQFNGKHYFGGLREGYVGYLPISAWVSEQAKTAAAQAADKIRNGSLSVYAGPIVDNTGVVRIKAGVVPTHDEIMNIDWFVQGVR